MTGLSHSTGMTSNLYPHFSAISLCWCSISLKQKQQNTQQAWSTKVIEQFVSGAMTLSRMLASTQNHSKALTHVVGYSGNQKSSAKKPPSLSALMPQSRANPTLLLSAFVGGSTSACFPLEPGYPRKVCLETSRKWLHYLGFEVLTVSKGIFIDGHERDDVVQARKTFLRKMTKIGFLHFTTAPTDYAARALPTDLDPPTLEQQSKTVVFFHDESAFMSNEDQMTQWRQEGEKMLRPKSKGAGIMVSYFVDEHNGFLALSDAEYESAKISNPHIRKYVREFLEYGESKQGYWTRDKFIAQMEKAIIIAEIKYPKINGWRHIWVFDHSSCHAAMADDALDVAKMNVKPGGKQRTMRDTVCDGKIWKLYFTNKSCEGDEDGVGGEGGCNRRTEW